MESLFRALVREAAAERPITPGAIQKTRDPAKEKYLRAFNEWMDRELHKRGIMVKPDHIDWMLMVDDLLHGKVPSHKVEEYRSEIMTRMFGGYALSRKRPGTEEEEHPPQIDTLVEALKREFKVKPEDKVETPSPSTLRAYFITTLRELLGKIRIFDLKLEEIKMQRYERSFTIFEKELPELGFEKGREILVHLIMQARLEPHDREALKAKAEAAKDESDLKDVLSDIRAAQKFKIHVLHEVPDIIEGLKDVERKDVYEDLRKFFENKLRQKIDPNLVSLSPPAVPKGLATAIRAGELTPAVRATLTFFILRRFVDKYKDAEIAQELGATDAAVQEYRKEAEAILKEYLHQAGWRQEKGKVVLKEKETSRLVDRVMARWCGVACDP